MVAKKKAVAGKGVVKKLTLKKETLRDLVVKGRARDVRGGNTALATCLCTAAHTNCKVSCVAVCGGGGKLYGG